MKFKGTAALFVVLVVLAGWVYWTDVRGREERELAEEAAGKVLPVDDQEIVEIRLTYPDRTIAARRAGDGWEFLEPAGLEADAGEWDIVAANVGRIDRDETVTAEPGDLAPYGLAEPGIRVRVVLADGASDEILFGNENPRGTFDYVKLASSDEVFLAATSWAGLFEKEPNDLRDKTILRFDQEAVEAVEVFGPNPLRLERDGTDWAMTAPLETAADSSQVTTLLGAIDFARASGFADPELGDAETGLDSPQWRIVLDAGETADELFIGGAGPDNSGQFYARDASRETVFLIDDEIAGMLAEPLLEWRDRTIAEFDRSAVRAIEIASGDGSVELHLTDAGDWLTDDNEPVDFSQVSSMLNGLEFEQAMGIIDAPESLAAYGLENPVLRLILRGADDAVLLEGLFGADAEDDEGIYWKSERESAVKILSRDVFDRFAVSEEDLLQSPPTAAPE